MEDYDSAFLERSQDTDSLDKNHRKIAAMHLGGITIECLLKSIIVASLPKKEWKTDSNKPGHTITNPGHSLTGALKRHQKLYQRVQQFPEVKKWLAQVENPTDNFIDIRYSANHPTDHNYKQWLKSYQSLMNWLEKQKKTL